MLRPAISLLLSCGAAVLPTTAVLVVVLYLIQLAQFSEMSGLGFVLCAGLLAVLMAIFGNEYHLFARQVLVRATFHDYSKLKSALHRASLLRVSGYLKAVGLAAILMIVSEGFTSLHWWFVYSLAVVVGFGVFYFRHANDGYVKERARQILNRRAIFWAIVAATLLIFVPLALIAEYPSYRGADLFELLRTGFRDNCPEQACSVPGFIAGLLDTLDKGTMFAAQTLLPQFSDEPARWIVWLYVAMRESLKIGIFAYLLMGVVASLQIKRERGWKVLGETVFAKSFMLTLFAIAALVFYLQNISTATTAQVDDREHRQRVGNSCEAAEATLADTIADEQSELVKVEAAVRAELLLTIDEQLDKVFSPIEGNVDNYLDWYFSVIGEYTRLGAVAVENFAESVEARISDNFVDPLEVGLFAMNTRLNADLSNRLEGIRETYLESMGATLAVSECAPAISLGPAGVHQPAVLKGQLLVAGGLIATAAGKKAAGMLAGKAAVKTLP